MDWTSFKFKDLINLKKNKLLKLPDGLKISTMCGKCKLNTILNIETIFNNLQLNSNDILTVKINTDKIKTLIPCKKKKRKEKPQTKFYNQITIVMRINEGESEKLDKEKKINLKIFNNGSIQMSGIKDLESVNRAINKLVYLLKNTKKHKFTENKIKIHDFEIYMINSNFKIKYNIDRDKLYNILTKNNYTATYEKCIRACVILKCKPKIHNPDNHENSIFIFQAGNIIITGARNMYHIIESFEFITEILFKNIEEIYKPTEEEEDNSIFTIYKSILEDHKHKLGKNKTNYANA